ncbi:hypothetical protein MYX84_08125 [Acidobacteria bacterium AH-259-O06]|nr:hypothetical protein [Acidobacteria bacterium AH-259-O06]
MPAGWDGPTESWTIGNIRDHLASVALWARHHAIPANRIIASEFGVDRRVDGAKEYLSDVTKVLNENGWHWAFYAYRGDGAWGGMDYELGTGRLDPRIWDAVDRGEDPEMYKKRHDNPLWQIIKREFKSSSH